MNTMNDMNDMNDMNLIDVQDNFIQIIEFQNSRKIKQFLEKNPMNKYLINQIDELTKLPIWVFSNNNAVLQTLKNYGADLRLLDLLRKDTKFINEFQEFYNIKKLQNDFIVTNFLKQIAYDDLYC